jgi:hypothetical protein
VVNATSLGAAGHVPGRPLVEPMPGLIKPFSQGRRMLSDVFL